MQASIVEALTNDDLFLAGIFFEPDKKCDKALLFIHGKGGSFYSDARLVDALKAEALRRGISFLSVNTRGHDYLANGKVLVNREILDTRIGHCVERFEDCLWDIAAWIDFLEGRGYREIALFGHSLGALKTAFYCIAIGDPRVRTLILGSPPDIFGIFKEALRRTQSNPVPSLSPPQHSLKAARGTPESFLVGDVENPYPLSPETIESFVGKNAKTNIFPFHDPKGDFTEFRKLTLPLFVFWGTTEEALVTNPLSALRRLRRHTRSTHFHGKIFRGVPHNYYLFEQKIARAVSRWALSTF